MKKFKELKVWQKAITLVTDVYSATKEYPKEAGVQNMFPFTPSPNGTSPYKGKQFYTKTPRNSQSKQTFTRSFLPSRGEMSTDSGVKHLLITGLQKV